ncbi:hypothetical protein E8E13_010940 [Curvularia kusanoi]|uniref:Uncharacterized protein n=1 Tax=Curvularia kusanoi TaxID=90978 RepID=A0A9P4TLL9_CURKU|nr:hypothetical protein E8E13_010940 [Curvularia kusanoi]
MAEEKKTPESKKAAQNGASDEEVRQESSKLAKQAKGAQDKATELLQAAAAAGDPEEREKLMKEALEKQMESKSLGKTASYLRSGTFQGMAVGAGLGVAPGASLGAITGTLVGSVTSTLLGGIGAGLGAAAGALHGPFFDFDKAVGKGIQKVAGLVPGWKATDDQKKQLEKMVGQINEQKAPGVEDLESWGNESVDAAKSSMPSAGGSEDAGKQDGSRKKPRKLSAEDKTENSSKLESPKKQPRKLEKR